MPRGLGDIEFQGMSCPVAVGAQRLDMVVKLSVSIPVSLAKSDVQLDASSNSGDKRICMKLQIEKAIKFARGFKGMSKTSNAIAPVFEITHMLEKYALQLKHPLIGVHREC